MPVFQTCTSPRFRVIAHGHFHSNPGETFKSCVVPDRTAVRILLLMRMCYNPATLIGFKTVLLFVQLLTNSQNRFSNEK